MDWILQNWQTIAALGVVALTLAIFAFRMIRPPKKSGCGGGCDCAGEPAGGLARKE